MKKPVIAALCCFLALGTATAAFAEEPTPTPAPELVELSPEDTAPQFYPDSISWQEDGGQMLVIKQYNVPYDTAVADLTESGMQWGGSDYTLWGVTQSVEGGVTEEKEVTQDFELSVRSADAETARNDVKESVAYDDEYGFSGSLTLQDITIGETLQADSTYMAKLTYQIFSVWVCDSNADTDCIQADPDDAAFQQILDKAVAGCAFDYGVDVTTADHILTLSTCTADPNSRLLVVAKLIDGGDVDVAS